MTASVNTLAFRNTIPADSQSQNETGNTDVHNTSLATSASENSVETEQITTFHDVEVPNRLDTPMAQNTSAAGEMDDTHSIVQFLQRPVLIETIEIISGTTNDNNKPLTKWVTNRANGQPSIKSWSLPSTVLSRGGKNKKLANFKYMRCDVKVKIVLNANPFIAGRLYLAYSPYNDTITPERQIQNTSRAGVTSYPGVEIDFQLDNSIEMTIPYASFEEAYDIVSDNADFVQLYLFTLTPILGPANPTANSKVDISVYMWLDNIQLVIPTYRLNSALNPAIAARTYTEYVPNPLDEQSKALQEALRAAKKDSVSGYNYILTTLQRFNPKILDVDMQVGAGAKPKASTSGAKPKSENPKIGPISELASGVKQAANGIERIPVVGELAKPVTTAVKWFADYVGKVAAIFGWSKPRNQEQVRALQNTPAWGYSLYKGIDMSVPLAYDPNNELGDLREVFPSAVDEMALGYVCANPGVKHVLDWTTTSAVQQPLVAGDDWGSVIPVGMPCYSKTIRSVRGDISTTNTEIMDPVPCEYVSNLFSYWRATMCYRITVVKTAFHTGRLEVFYEPGMVPLTSTATNVAPNFTQLTGAIAPSDNNYKYILDLTNDTEVTIKVPYVSNKMFMKTTGVYGANSENNWNFSESYTGFLCIRPINKLMAPDTVSDKVSVIIWKWAEDVVLVEPKPLISGSTTIFNPPATATSRTVKPAPRTEIPKEDKPKGGKKNNHGILDHIIDKIPIKQVTMQINLKNTSDENTITFFDSSSAERQNNEALMRGCGENIVNLRTLLRTFRTISDNYVTQAVTTTPITTLVDQANSEGRDYMSYLSFIYRFYRGGKRYKFFNITDMNSNRTYFMQSFLCAKNMADSQNPDGPTHITYSKLNPVHEVEVPFYCQYRKLPLGTTTDTGYESTLMTSTSQTMSHKVMRAGNDDFSFGWLVGTPQVQGIVTETAN